MGKKSKKKAKKNESHQARMQARTERREEERVAAEEKEEGSEQGEYDYTCPIYGGKPRQFLDGDFVRHYDLGDGDRMTRGVIHKKREGSDNELPKGKFEFISYDEKVKKIVDVKDVYADLYSTQVRFQEGTIVLCRTEETGEQWVKSAVTKVWPRPPRKNDRDGFPLCPLYLCHVLQTKYPFLIYVDDDETIKQFSTFTRFVVGDKVVFNASKAEGLTKQAQRVLKDGKWLDGEVVRVNPMTDATLGTLCGMRDAKKYTGVYECYYRNKGKTHCCLVFTDDDENIASSEADPRSRLMDAIESDCSLEHFLYLLEEYNIDVMTFQDLFVSKAIEHASYNALWLLEEKFNINLSTINGDTDGLILMDQVARSSNALRFFKKATEVNICSDDGFGGIHGLTLLLLADYTRDKDKCPRFLCTLMRCNTLAFDYVLSSDGLAWFYASWTSWDGDLGLEDQLRLAEGTIGIQDLAILRLIVNKFLAFKNLERIAAAISGSLNICGSKEERQKCLEQDLMKGKLARLTIKRYLRLCWDYIDADRAFIVSRYWEYKIYKGHEDMMSLASEGNYRMYRLLAESDPNLMKYRPRAMSTPVSVDQNEYIQSDLIDTKRFETYEDKIYEDNNLYATLVHGMSMDSSYSSLYKWKDNIWKYELELMRFLRGGRHISNITDWVSEMKNIVESPIVDNFKQRVFKRKIDLMEDDATLEGRLKILEYVVIENGYLSSDIDPFVAIRFRRCGVVRWLFKKKLISIDKPIDTNSSYFVSLHPFLEGNEINHFESTGFLLCTAAIIYDDFQTIQWLVNEFGTDILEPKKQGMNLVHVAAYFGRIEIMYLLCSFDSWQSLVVCTVERGTYKGMYASHVAVLNGHIRVTDMLLANGCPGVDLSGVSVVQHAIKSKHAFVARWAEEQGPGTQQLKTNIEEMLELAQDGNTSPDKIKDYVIKSKFMDISAWTDCGCTNCHEEGQLGISFSEVLRAFCESASFEVSVWLCSEIIFGEIRYTSREFFEKDPWGKKEKCIDAVHCSCILNDDDIIDWLAQDWAKGVRCRDQIEDLNPVIQLVDKCSKLKDLLISKVMRVEILESLKLSCRHEIENQILHGTNSNDLEDYVSIQHKIYVKLEGEALPSDMYHPIVSIDKKIDMSWYCFGDEFKISESHYVYEQLVMLEGIRHLNRVLLLHTRASLIEFCLKHRCNFDARNELDFLYTASYLARKDVVDIFLRGDNAFGFSTLLEDRFWVAALAAAERGHLGDLQSYLKCTGDKVKLDPVKTSFSKLLENGLDFSEERDSSDSEERDSSDASVSYNPNGLTSSLCLFIVYGFLLRHNDLSSADDIITIEESIFELKDFASMGDYSRKHLLLAACLVVKGVRFRSNVESRIWKGIIYFYKCLSHNSGFDMEERAILCKLTEYLINIYKESFNDNDSLLEPILESWNKTALNLGIGIDQYINKCYKPSKEKFLRNLVDVQKLAFQRLDGLKKGCSLQDLKTDFESGTLDMTACDGGGLFLVHIAAAYDRIDVLEWLDETQNDSLSKVDGQGRSVLEVAESSKARNAIIWIQRRQAGRTIFLFWHKNLLRKRAVTRLNTLLHGIRRFQAVFRGFKIRKNTRHQLFVHKKTSHQFHLIWSGCIAQLEMPSSNIQSWSLTRDLLIDFIRPQESIVEEDLAMKSALKSDSAGEGNIEDSQGEDGDMDTTVDELLSNCHVPRSFGVTLSSDKGFDFTYTNIQYTSEVAKWLKRCDPKYKEFFIKRMKQLHQGERSRILAKRLKGSKSTVYETYLEQKSGFRILWTIEGDNMLVWYVAKHDNVSRLLERIDDSQNRSTRQLVSASHLIDTETEIPTTDPGKQRIKLNPLGNVPLQIYEVAATDVGDIVNESWVPNLKLTDEEREVVETKGTVMLLGRSGTGKTICICNRMDYDRQRLAHDTSFTQLFVARSQGLCNYVSDALGTTDNTSFTTFDNLLRQLENDLPKVENTRDSFSMGNRMTFGRFKSEVYGAEKDIDPLLIWTSIRSFIKGSIEAIQKSSFAIERADFLNFKRSRLSVDQRQLVYDIYERYEKYMSDFSMWDDCDRMMALLQRLEHCKSSNPDTYHEVRKSKIYVDEIQDYTQAECLLFFYLSGPGDLFLAGDPAQSVVEGVEFRFEDIRSVGYHMAQIANVGKDIVLRKPKVVNVNFRSHAGVLNTASAILSCMFKAFPDSATQLKEDHGIFQGPRPGIFYNVESDLLASLLKIKLNGTVVLVHDMSVSRCKRALGNYELVYGIRAAKGLEFKSVIILDFFRDLPSKLQKPWRDLLLGRAGEDFQRQYPEIEGQLKLLYTGVTRCIEQLFFAETEGGCGGDAFCLRWATTTSILKQQRTPLATKNKVGDVEKMVMTRDEWLSAGFENAEKAEEEGRKDDFDAAESLLDKAIYCFQQANDHNLASKARAHRLSIRFKSKLPPHSAVPASSEDAERNQKLEVEAAEVIENLLKESLLGEAKDLCTRVQPRLPSQSAQHLKREILSKLAN